MKSRRGVTAEPIDPYGKRFTSSGIKAGTQTRGYAGANNEDGSRANMSGSSEEARQCRGTAAALTSFLEGVAHMRH